MKMYSSHFVRNHLLVYFQVEEHIWWMLCSVRLPKATSLFRIDESSVVNLVVHIAWATADDSLVLILLKSMLTKLSLCGPELFPLPISFSFQNQGSASLAWERLTWPMKMIRIWWFSFMDLSQSKVDCSLYLRVICASSICL